MPKAIKDRRRREFADPERPELGLFFDGRVAKDFKLDPAPGSASARARRRDRRLAPLAQDIVVTGHGGDGPLPGVPQHRGCRAHAGLPDNAGANEVIGHRKGPRRDRAGARKAEGAGRQLVRPRHARAAAGRTCFRRWRRDHRQGLHQPACGADPAGRRGGDAGRRRVDRVDRVSGLSSPGGRFIS